MYLRAGVYTVQGRQQNSNIPGNQVHSQYWKPRHGLGLVKEKQTTKKKVTTTASATDWLGDDKSVLQTMHDAGAA